MLEQCNDSRKDQSVGEQARGSTGLKEGSGLCCDCAVTVLYGSVRAEWLMQWGQRTQRCEHILRGVKDEVRESAIGEDFQQKLVVG